jgi:hypothetical protein
VGVNQQLFNILNFWISGAKQKTLGGAKCKQYKDIGDNFKIPGDAPSTYTPHM